MTELSQYGVVTKAGISAAIDAGRAGPEVRISKFRIGSLSAAEGTTASEDDTDVDGFVYEGTAEEMRYVRIDEDTVVWRISLGQTTGDFDVGNIGLVLESGVMFAKAVLPGQSAKFKSNPPTIIGNRKFYNIVLTLSNISSLIDINVVQSMEASLPEVPTELDLPDPNTTPFNTYLVLTHTHINTPTVAVRRNGEWYHRSYYKYPNQGIGVLASETSLYAAPAVVGRAVKFDTGTNKFVLADGANVNLQPDGIRTSSYELTTMGMIGAAEVGLATPLTPGTLYYAGTGGTIGQLVTTPNGRVCAIAVNTTDLWINLGNALLITSSGSGSDPTIYVTVAPDAVEGGAAAGAPVYLDGPTRTWRTADPLVAIRRPVGVLSADRTRVILLGRVDIVGATSAWPKPLTAGALYYAGTGADAGKIVSTNATRYLVGTAHGDNTLMVKLEAFATNTEHLAANATAITAKAATPSGVKAAIDEHAASRNHPSATMTLLGFGRPATNAEVLAGAPAVAPAYQFPWVTPQQLATYPFPQIDTNLFVLKAGSSMNANANLIFQGTGHPLKGGSAYWHPSNDGAGSGLDADLLDGIDASQFVRNDTDSESIANGRLTFRKDALNGDRGVLEIRGRTGQAGGGVVGFMNGLGSTMGMSLESSADRRTLHGRMFSDNGVTYEDQFRFTDDGDLWLRKFNKKISELGVWETHEATFNNVASWAYDITNYSIVMWSYSLSRGGGGGRGGRPLQGEIHLGDGDREPDTSVTGLWIRIVGTNRWETRYAPSRDYDDTAFTLCYGWSTGNMFTLVPQGAISSTVISGSARLVMMRKGALG